MRRIIVTGGGAGMGRAIAERFVRQGDEVHILGRREKVLEQVVAANAEASPDAGWTTGQVLGVNGGALPGR
ncbi:SDR family NAD(P)-dependent oxidoreductase [Nocardiopsis alkaliphila]|uniref:SDR family NAD(P)-dependent oxidoreductase n=1 Tax=Nocardiopsis alkaliphila TaxID=225762 RepID=UPI00034CFD5C|nr:SDR family NAD(P)-dependent oxidoreductase [Nocardiopsis alkaliphila]